MVAILLTQMCSADEYSDHCDTATAPCYTRTGPPPSLKSATYDQIVRARTRALRQSYRVDRRFPKQLGCLLCLR